MRFTLLASVQRGNETHQIVEFQFPADLTVTMFSTFSGEWGDELEVYGPEREATLFVDRTPVSLSFIMGGFAMFEAPEVGVPEVVTIEMLARWRDEGYEFKQDR